MKILEIVEFTCSCGKQIRYENPNKGAISVGHLHSVTGWFSLGNSFDGNSIYLCPECASKAIELASSLESILGTKNVILSCILSFRDWGRKGG